MTGISVISYLYDKLKNNSDLTNIVGDRIFPIVAEENTLYPYLIMKIESILPAYTKDGRIYDAITVSLTAYAKDYIKVTQIQEICRDILESSSFRLDSMNEDFNNDAYRQQVNYLTNYKIN